MRTFVQALVLTVGLAWSGSAETRSRVFPAPTVLLDSQAVSIGVVQARADDAGFRQLFATAWDAMKHRNGGSGGFLDLVTAFLSRSTQENILLGFLPFQGVRIDNFDENGENHASFMVSLGGFYGIQGLFYNSLLNGPDGKPYPTERVAGETVIVRQKPGMTAEQAGVVARVDGTFYSFSDLRTARRVLENQTGENPDLRKVLAGVDASNDTYGAIVNRQEALLRFLTWINKRDFEAVRQAVGEEKLRNTLGTVKYLSWQGDLISDDRMDMQVRFHAGKPEEAEALEDVLQTAHDALAARGRMGDWQMTTVEEDVLLGIQFTGYRKMLTDYLTKS